MDSLHHLGLSWAVVIPCTAGLLRGIVTYYLITLPQRRKDRQEAAIRPLIHAYTLWHREQPVEKEKEMKAFQEAGTKGLRAYKRSWQFRASLRGWWELGYLTGVSRWQTVGSKLANFGILVVVMEAIRLRCGRGEGLLSLLLTPLTPVWNHISEALAELRQRGEVMMAQNGSPPAVGAASVTSIESPEAGGVGETTAEIAAASPAADAYSPLPDATPLSTIDPTLQVEGLPFCPDLTLADPTGILPVSLFFAMAINAFLSPRPPKSFVAQKTWIRAINEKWRTLPFGQRITIFVAGYFWIVAQSLPAGMVLYIITNSLIGFAQRVWLDIKYPTLKAITPCIRPVRQKRKRLW
jgi:inner membrane protein COX18